MYFGIPWLNEGRIVFEVLGWILLIIGILSLLRAVLDLLRLCTRNV